MAKPTILALCDYYRPGFKAGGPIVSISNLVARLHSEFDFKIVTRNRHAGDTTPYPQIEPLHWYPVDAANVCYLTDDWRGMRNLYSILRETHYDVLYLNSLFSPMFTGLPLLLRRLWRLPKRPAILAPRGELAPAALANKSGKKASFLAAAKSLRLYDHLVWQASSEFEQEDIEREFGSDRQIWIAPDLVAPASDLIPSVGRREERTEGLKLLFLSRICRAKNLAGALEILAGVKSRVRFEIAGPIEDPQYWESCKAIADELPENISVHYRGEVQPDEVAKVMHECDLFFLPTLGENFGHVILEALTARCPVLISDRTPWRELKAAGIGWEIPIESTDLFRSAIESCAKMDAEALEQMRDRAGAYARDYLMEDDAIYQNRILFQATLGPDASSHRGSSRSDPS